MKTNRIGSADVLVMYDCPNERKISEELMKKHHIKSYTLTPMPVDPEVFLQKAEWRGKVVVAMHTSSITSIKLAATPYQALKQGCDKIGAAFRVFCLNEIHTDFFSDSLSGCCYNEHEFDQLLFRRQITLNPTVTNILKSSRIKRWFAPLCLTIVAIAAAIFAAHRLYTRFV